MSRHAKTNHHVDFSYFLCTISLPINIRMSKTGGSLTTKKNNDRGICLFVQ